MKRASIHAVKASPAETGVERRKLGDALATADFAVNHYVLEPGERFSESLHAHMDQEEVFVVLDGEATFETHTSSDEESQGCEITVGENEAVRFAPGEFQFGWNGTDERVVALALGAPHDTDDIRIARIPGVGEITCPECGRDDMRASTAETLVCPDCDAALTVE